MDASADTRSKRCRHNWSQVLPEVLDLILQSLGHPDCFNFGKVCTSWRSVFLSRRSITRPPPCILLTPLLPLPQGYTSEPIPLQLWGLYEKKVLKVRCPRPEILPNEEIVGSSKGWLVVAPIINYGLHLVDPITNKRIPLPSMASIGDNVFVVKHVVISSASSSCVIVARGWYAYKPYDGFAWCRLGDPRWRIVPWSIEIKVEDTMFHKDELYVLGNNGEFLVYAFAPQPKLTRRGFITVNTANQPLDKWQLVDSGEEIMSIAQQNSGYKPLCVFRKCDDSEWVRVESLGDRVLLKGKHGAICLNKQGMLGSSFKANCIYYLSWTNVTLDKFSLADERHQSVDLPVARNATFFGVEKRLIKGIDWITAQAW